MSLFRFLPFRMRRLCTEISYRFQDLYQTFRSCSQLHRQVDQPIINNIFNMYTNKMQKSTKGIMLHFIDKLSTSNQKVIEIAYFHTRSIESYPTILMFQHWKCVQIMQFLKLHGLSRVIRYGISNYDLVTLLHLHKFE